MSDLGDIYQLAIIRDVDLAVIGNEKNDLFQRINQGNLFPEKLRTCNLAQFRKTIMRRTEIIIETLGACQPRFPQ